VPALLIEQAIGCWGNFVNQELYDPPIDLPRTVMAPSPIRHVTRWRLRFHPDFLYESVLNVLGFMVLTKVVRRLRLRSMCWS